MAALEGLVDSHGRYLFQNSADVSWASKALSAASTLVRGSDSMMAGLNIVVVPAGAATTLPPRFRMTSLLANASRMASARLISIASWSPRVLRGARRCAGGQVRIDRGFHVRVFDLSRNGLVRTNLMLGKMKLLAAEPAPCRAQQQSDQCDGNTMAIVHRGPVRGVTLIQQGNFGDGTRRLDARTIG